MSRLDAWIIDQLEQERERRRQEEEARRHRIELPQTVRLDEPDKGEEPDEERLNILPLSPPSAAIVPNAFDL